MTSTNSPDSGVAGEIDPAIDARRFTFGASEPCSRRTQPLRATGRACASGGDSSTSTRTVVPHALARARVPMRAAALRASESGVRGVRRAGTRSRKLGAGRAFLGAVFEEADAIEFGPADPLLEIFHVLLAFRPGTRR